MNYEEDKHMKRIIFVWIAAITLTCSAFGAELLRNADLKLVKQGLPAHWALGTFGGKSTITLSPKSVEGQRVFDIRSERVGGKGSVGQLRLGLNVAAQTTFRLSGWYKTDGLSLGEKGMLRVECKYNRQVKADAAKRFQKMNQAMLLAPTNGKWRRFESVKALSSPVADFRFFVLGYHFKGQLSVRGLAVEGLTGTSDIRREEKYVWREAEDLAVNATFTTWGKDVKDYFSGRGAVAFVKKPFQWQFRIPAEVDEKTLFPKRRTYFVWLRMYGYLDSPPVTVQFGKKQIGSFHTVSNEQANAAGEYSGPGAYYWQKAGSFATAGGGGSLKVIPDGRMTLDAVLITTDPNYRPEKYEGRKAPGSDFFTDVKVAHTAYPHFRLYGITDKMATPLAFSFMGNVVRIPNDQKPAVFHLALPQEVELKHVSSHWAGRTWNYPNRWGEKKLSWKKTGTEVVNGVTLNRYEIYFYYMSIEFTAFVQARAEGFRLGRSLVGESYLEYRGEKQPPEKLSFLSVDLKPTRPFKSILIGPCAGNFRSFYLEYPGLREALGYSGINFINPWHINTDRYPDAWHEFRKQYAKANITISGEYSPFCGIYFPKAERDWAVGLDGKPVRNPHLRPSLAIDLSSPELRDALGLIRRSARDGVGGMAFDDEHTNRAKDSRDYSERVKVLFREYMKKGGKGAYRDPVEIVKNKAKYPALYRHWVDFKCERNIAPYRLYRKAFLEGRKEARGINHAGRPLFIAQILKDNSPEQSKVNSYWDYRKLAEECDFVSPMVYTYRGVKDSATVGNIIEMYHKYIGKTVIAPTLDCGQGPGAHETLLPNKKKFKYEILESLMQQSKLILFYTGPSMLDPVNLQHISEAIRWAGPYEEIILKGSKYSRATSPELWVRIKGLRLGKRVLLYVANYRNAIDKPVQVKLQDRVKTVLEVGLGKQVAVKQNHFNVDFRTDRGKLFLVVLDE
jgi:hypothetical protein